MLVGALRAARSGGGSCTTLDGMIGPSHFVTTDHFKVRPGEDKDTNPGIYGEEFSNWLAEQFRARGEVVAEVVPEDFGWCVLLRASPVRYWVGCGNREETKNEWGAYVVAEPSLVQRLFKRIDVRPEVERLSVVLEAIMRNTPGASAHSIE